MTSVVWPIQWAEAGQLDLEEMEHDMSAPLVVLGSGPWEKSCRESDDDDDDDDADAGGGGGGGGGGIGIMRPWCIREDVAVVP